MDAVYNIYVHLKHHDKSTMVFDDAKINWSDFDFSNFDCEGFYKVDSEVIPHNAPEPRGVTIQINVSVEANHERNRLNRGSHTGILMYLNMALVM